MFHFQQNCHLFCSKSNNNNFMVLNRGTLFQNGLVQLLGKQDRCFVQTFLRVFSLGQPIPKNCSGTFFKNGFDLWQVQSCRRLYCHFTLESLHNKCVTKGRKETKTKVCCCSKNTPWLFLLYLVDGEDWGVWDFGVLLFRDLLLAIEEQKWFEGRRCVHRLKFKLNLCYKISDGMDLNGFWSDFLKIFGFCFIIVSFV